MARKEQTGSGAGRAGRAHRGRAGGRRSGGRTSRSRKRQAAPHRAARLATPARAAQTTQSVEHPQAGSAWSGSAGAVGSPTPLLALPADQASLAAPLALVGAEQTTLSEALRAWGATRDQAANRAWRRPGGLTRMAGL